MSDLFHFLNGLKGKRILGINPPVFDFAYFDLWAKPIGLLYLLQWMRDLGNEVQFLDCIYEARDKAKSFGRYQPRRTLIEKPEAYRGIPRRYYHFGLEEEEFLSRLLAMEEPDLVLVTSIMTYWYGGVHWAISRVRKIFPDVPVVLGGIYARLCPGHAISSGADMIQTEYLPVQAPYPAMDLYENGEYGILETSWGCPMGCDYCASKILCPSFSQRSIEEVALEMDFQLKVPSIRDMAFYDDALLMNREFHFYRICDLIQERYSHIRFHTPNGLHVSQIDRKCAKYLFNTGLRTIRLSLESVDRTVQGQSSMKVSRLQFERALENLVFAGYGQEDLETYVFIGLPEQDIDGVRKTIRFVKSLGGTVKTAQFSPIPGTSSYRKALENVPALKEEPLLHNNSVYCSYISGELEPAELQELKDLARA